jgi:ubiquinol-cytochrome c reductase cytochrome b subunit
MVSLMTMYALFWLAGGNDLIATQFHASLNEVTYFMRGAVFIGPAIAFFITRRWCIALQRHDNETLLHGYETGVIMRSPDGAYSERHLPISESKAYTITVRDRGRAGEDDGPKANGKTTLRDKLRTLYYDDDVQKPTVAELEEAHHHAEGHELEGSDHH